MGSRDYHHAAPDLDRTVRRDDLRSLKATKIGSKKGLRSLVIQLKDRPLERIASQLKLQPATEQIGNLPWSAVSPLPSSLSTPRPVSWAISGRGELIAAEPTFDSLGGRRAGRLGASAASRCGWSLSSWEGWRSWPAGKERG